MKMKIYKFKFILMEKIKNLKGIHEKQVQKKHENNYGNLFII